MTPYQNFTGWNSQFGDLPLWSGYQAPTQDEKDYVRQLAMAEANRVYGGRPDNHQIEDMVNRYMRDFQDWHFAQRGGTMVPRELSNEAVVDRVDDMRSGYSTDPNYFRNLLPAGFEDFSRANQQWDASRAMAEGIGPQNNYSLGPVDGTNFMFLGSRGARPEDNPASAQFAVNSALRDLGMPGPNYTLPQSDPLSYVVPTDRELELGATTKGGRNGGGAVLKAADDWAQEQAWIKQQEAYDAAFKQAGNDFAQWALFNMGDADVQATFGNADGLVDPRTLRADVTSWFAENSNSDLARRGLKPWQFGALQDPVRSYTDPSWGILNQAGANALQGDLSTMMGDRQANQIRQQQAYNSIGDGQWGGVLNQQTYSRPDFRQITGQQPAQMSPFGGLGGLGGAPGFQMPSMGNPGAPTGAAYNPNPFAALTSENKNTSPWGGPWGGR